MAVYIEALSETLYIGEVTGTNILPVAVADTLPFSENDDGHNLHQTVNDYLYASGRASWTIGTHMRVSDALVFRELAGRMRTGQVYENLVIVQSAGLWHPRDAAEILVFRDSVTVYRGHDTSDALVFVETVALAFTRQRGASDVLAYTEYPVLYNPTRIVGGPITHTQVVTLVTPAGSITLPVPDFGDTDDISHYRIQRQSRGGTTIIFRAPLWPTSEDLNFTFSYLSESQVALLRSLVSRSVGRLCLYYDQEGTTWSIVVTTPELVVTQAGRHNYQATFKATLAN